MAGKPFPYRDYLAPGYWPMWLGFGLLKAATRLPVNWSLAIGDKLGWLIYHLVASRRHVACLNIKQAYPDYTEAQRQQLNLACFRSLGMSIFETAYAWYGTDAKLRKICAVEGLHHVEQARENGRGVIILTGHFTTLDIGGRLSGFYLSDYNGVYKKAHNPLFNAMMTHCRARYGNALIENRDVRKVIKGLKQGNPTWFAPDQDFADQDIVFTPFLGGLATTLTATAKMARLTGASVIPFCPVRLDKTRADGVRYKMVFYPPLENF
ncbi:MAG TPA: lipid A biosynthesis lauroyl acyltransferase, partial [Thiotrichales bacterium]|nr:lipid A biosynthesis lauroyl acyltransferase [Thiotrichales bacterium]